ncbi:glycosyltransferase family 61 protein [Asaia prunellae]|uniref:glycosyltransferase family 61 protein n=1 Tax=Asaia prunellae TaxID=610245 RepID=UPI000472C1B3|nr:glycosyltransferase 61 family protein [Asaia prunellae]
MIMVSHCVDYGLQIFDNDPPIQTFHDTLYIPRIPGHYDSQFGLYDNYGRLIPTAGPRRGWPNAALGQSPSCCVSPSDAFPLSPEPTYFYGGNITPHYGHFMTETLPHYWCGRRFYEGLKILVHAEKTLDSLFALPWLADFFSLLGLERKDFVVFERPTRIRMLIVAGSAFEENHFAHKAFARYCNELGEKHGEDIADGRPIYLSRAQYKSEMRQIDGEPEVGAYLAREGFSIVAPETLQVRQQLRLFSEHRPTVGFVGSAFHNSIFCRRPVGVALTCDGLISSNFALMDQANEARIQYVTAPEVTLEKFVLGQPALYRLNDPVHTARVLVDLVYRRVWQNEKTHDAEGIDKEKTYLIRTYHQSWMQIDRQTGIVFHGNGEGERIVRLVLIWATKAGQRSRLSRVTVLRLRGTITKVQQFTTGSINALMEG